MKRKENHLKPTVAAVKTTIQRETDTHTLKPYLFPIFFNVVIFGMSKFLTVEERKKQEVSFSIFSPDRSY